MKAGRVQARVRVPTWLKGNKVVVMVLGGGCKVFGWSCGGQ